MLDQETKDHINDVMRKATEGLKAIIDIDEADNGIEEHMKVYNTAMSKVQAHIEGAFKDKNNPFFKSSYADLESVWGVARKPLADHGFSVAQTPCKGGVHLITTIRHISGAWVRGSWPLNTVKKDPQGFMASVTYARRGALASMLGIYQTDDDGNEASGKTTSANNKITPLKAVKTPQPKNKDEDVQVEKVVDMVRDVFDENAEKLSAGRVKTLTAKVDRLSESGKKKFFEEICANEVAQIRKDEYVKAVKLITKIEKEK